MAHVATIINNLKHAADRMHANLIKHGGSVTITFARRHRQEFSQLNSLLEKRRQLEISDLSSRGSDWRKLDAALAENGFALELNPGKKGWLIHSLRF
jgi:hypothetical protein